MAKKKKATEPDDGASDGGTPASAEKPARTKSGKPKSKNRVGRQKGNTTPKAQLERQERIREALDYRRLDFTYSQIAEAMGIAPSTAYEWVQEGLAAIPQDSANELRKIMFGQCQEIMQRLMPLLDDGAPGDVIDGILKTQGRMMQLVGLAGNLNVNLPGVEGGADGDSETVIIQRIKASAPVLCPDGPVPANPIL